MANTTADGVIVEPETSSRRASGQAEAPAVPIDRDELMDAYRCVRGATPVGHVRRTERSFFQRDARWQHNGIRLAKDASRETQ